MKCYGVKFLLAGGQFFLAFMPEMQARELVKKWARGDYSENKFIAGQAQVIPGISYGEDWAVPITSIIAMHTFEGVVQAPSPMQGYPTGPFPTNTSGVYFK